MDKVQEELKSEGLRDLALNAGASDVVSFVFQGELASKVICMCVIQVRGFNLNAGKFHSENLNNIRLLVEHGLVSFLYIRM